MAKITKTTIESDAHKNIYDIINTRAYVADPRGGAERKFVYYSDPLHKHTSFSDFPYVVVGNPVVEYSKVSCNGKVKTIGFTHKLFVRTAKDGSFNAVTGSSEASTGMQDMWGVCDDLHELFNTEARKAALRALNVFTTDLSKDNFSDDLFIMEKNVFESEFTLTYELRLKVSD